MGGVIVQKGLCLPIMPSERTDDEDRRAMQSHSAARTASGATQPWIASIRPRPARKVAARASTHRYPQTVIAQRAEDYPNDGSGSYARAYPPAPWQVPRYAYYYSPFGYYPRYSYYYYSTD